MSARIAATMRRRRGLGASRGLRSACAPALLLVAACAPSAPAASPPAAPGAVASACATPEHRALDFWIGEWDARIRAKAPKGEEWIGARGTNRITSILGGCALEEDFRAEGPDAPWAGKSLSRWVPAEGRWRQTWVDDSGGYLVFVGGPRPGGFTFVGEPRVKDGVPRQMRMVFSEVTRDRFRWTWEATTDGGATWAPEMVIDYTRRTR